MKQLAIRTTAVFAAMAAVIILAFAAAMTVAAQADTPEWRLPVTGLTAVAGDQAGEIDLTWDSHPQTSKTLSDYRVTWTPEGQDFKSNEESAWYAYPTANRFTVTGLDAGETYKVRVRARYDDAKKSNWSTVVTGTAAENSAQGDETPAPNRSRNHETPPNISINDSDAFESTINGIRFPVNLPGPAIHEVTFTWATSIEFHDTAETGDFTAVTGGSGTILTGHEETAIYVYPVDDNIYEGDETFTVTISNVINATPFDTTATGTITENENQPELSISAASATEGNDIEFIVLLTGPLTEDDVTFNYATSIESDDNSEDIDFTPTSGTGTITAGNTATTFTVPTYDDGSNNDNSVYEGDETFTVTISNPTVAAISQATAMGTILNDEDVPTASFRTVSQHASENAGTINNFIQFDIAPLNEGSAQISLTITGTATAGQDYETPDTTLTLSPGQTQFSEPITINDDNVYELSETVTVQLVAVSDNIQIEPNFNTKTLYISDDDPPVLSFDGININVDEDAGTAVLTVNKTGLTGVTATVEYETRRIGSINTPDAREGEDYEAKSGTLTFAPHETSKTITIPIVDDNIYEDIPDQFRVYLENPSQATLSTTPYYANVSILSDDPPPTASMKNVTTNERTGTMTLTLRLSHPSEEDLSYRNPQDGHLLSGTATLGEDYLDIFNGSDAWITVPARQLSTTFEITLIDDGLEEPDETIEIQWTWEGPSQVLTEYLLFTGTITDPPVCDALGNLENTIVVMNLTGEITQPGQSKFHRIRLDPYRSYLIEAIGQVGQDMLGVEEHPNLTLSNPNIPAIWNAKATSKWSTYGGRNDGDQAKNTIRRFLDSSYRTYKIEVNAGNNGTGTYQLKIRVNNICRLDENENAHYQWAGGPKGYPANSDLPAGTGGRQALLTGTDWGNDNITRPEMHHVLGDNWNSNRDEDWIGVDLEGGAEYTVRLRTKNSLPERLQATGLKILGMKDESGNAIAGTASTGSIGTTVFLTNFEAPSTGRFYIAVGSEGTDRTGTYWLSIYKQIPE